ncbi:MAG: phytanoyl-CoA dioxygenase family protein [Alphaproteobacteria bacterium]
MAFKKEVDAYRREGFAVLKDVIPQIRVDALRAEVEDIFRPILRKHAIDGAKAKGQHFEDALISLFSQNLSEYLAAAKATQFSPGLHALGASEPIIEIVRAFGIAQPLIAVRPVTHILSESLKVPGGYHRTPPHQDWRSVQGSLDAIVVWLPLVSVDRGFGALEVIPGSHLRGLLPTCRDSFGNVIDEKDVDLNGFIPVEVEPGDAVVFSMFTVHRTGAEQRAGIRWAVSLRYNNAAAPDFADHGYPDPFVYKPQDDLLFDEFPSPEAVRQIFKAG